MLLARMDSKGSFRIQWPTTDDGCIALAETWITFEESRTAALQRKDPWLTLIKAKTTAAKAADNTAATSEAARSFASEAFKTKLAQAKTYLQHAFNVLKFQHRDNLYELEYWGPNVRRTSRGISIRLPTKPSEIIALLERYVTHEATRGPAQLTEPPLATMEALLVDLKDLAGNRGSSRAARTSKVYERNTTISELDDLLIGAAIAISLFEFGGKVHPDMAQWGYTIVAVAPPPNGEEPPEEEPPAA